MERRLRSLVDYIISYIRTGALSWADAEFRWLSLQRAIPDYQKAAIVEQRHIRTAASIDGSLKSTRKMTPIFCDKTLQYTHSEREA